MPGELEPQVADAPKQIVTKKAVAALLEECASIRQAIAAIESVYGARLNGATLQNLSRAAFDLMESENGHETEWRRDVGVDGHCHGGRYWSKRLKGADMTLFTHEPPVKRGVSEIVEIKKSEERQTIYAVGSDGVARVAVICKGCYERRSPIDVVGDRCRECYQKGGGA